MAGKVRFGLLGSHDALVFGLSLAGAPLDIPYQDIK